MTMGRKALVGKGSSASRGPRFATKADLLAGGTQVRALRYQRASQDKKEQGKSVHDQGVLNVAEINRNNWSDVGSFTDNHRSASRHATKDRPEFEALMDDIRAGHADVLVVWEISRNQRDLGVYVQIRDLCTQVGLFFWHVGGVLYDLRDKNDRMMLGFQAVQAEWLADSIRDNVLRGMVGAAEAGRPHGRVTYGFRRIYHERTKALLRQEPDIELRAATGADGRVYRYSRAAIVRWLTASVAAGVALSQLARRLNERGIPTAEGAIWRPTVVRRTVLNPGNIGKRVFRGEVVGDGIWSGLVDEESYWAAVRVLEDPSRVTTRPGRAVHLVSYVARCGKCGGEIAYAPANARRKHAVYQCLHKGCSWLDAAAVDEYVTRTVVGWLSRDDVDRMLTAGTGDDAEVVHARAEASRLRAELGEYRQLAAAGQLGAIDYLQISRGLEQRIAEHEQRAADAGIPPVLRGRTGVDAAPAWHALVDDTAARREIIRTVAEIRLLPAPRKGDRSGFGPHRVAWTWRYVDPVASAGNDGDDDTDLDDVACVSSLSAA